MSDYNIYKPSQRYTCGDIHESFESYYDCHCALPAKWASWLFYAGTLSLLIAACYLQVLVGTRIFASCFVSCFHLRCVAVLPLTEVRVKCRS
jgi:hypothetical protein